MPTTTSVPQPRAAAVRPSGLTAFVVDHPLLSYFMIAYAGAWLAVLPVVLAKNNLGLLPFALDAPVFVWLGALT